MSEYYAVTKRTAQLYSLLGDDVSRELFWARLRYDVEPNMDNMLALFKHSVLPDKDVTLACLEECIETIDRLMREGKEVILYGAGIVGRYFGHLLLSAGHDFSGYCDQNHNRFPNGVWGKPVYFPSHLMENKEKCYVLIAVNTVEPSKDIKRVLQEMGFPVSHLLPLVFDADSEPSRTFAKSYYDFAALYPKGKAMVDGGCYDGEDSLRFAAWSGGEYTKIFAFEPDPKLFKNCKSSLQDVERTEVLQAGLGVQTTCASFLASGDMAGFVVDKGRTEMLADPRVEEVQLLALDDLAKDCEVGFIKLDIEGAELDALKGARKTILRDKPFMAICVYHKPGDMLAIMDYIDSLNLGYRFLLRHYTLTHTETVLYASTDMQ